MDHTSRFRVVFHVSNLDPVNHFFQHVRCQFFDGSIIRNCRMDLPAFHASGECPHLIQHIGIQHLVVDDVGLGTGLRMPVVVCAEVDIRLPVLELLPGNCQRMPTAVTVQQIPEQVFPPFLCWTAVFCPNLLHPLKVFRRDNRIMSILRDDASGFRNGNPLFGLAVNHLCFQANQRSGVNRIFQNLADGAVAPAVWLVIFNGSIFRKARISILISVIGRSWNFLRFQLLCNCDLT